jgi:hypothetical protein
MDERAWHMMLRIRNIEQSDEEESMKASTWIAAAVVALWVSVGARASTGAQGAMDKAGAEKALMANEQKVNEAFQKRDTAAFRSLVAADGISVDSGGITMGLADIEKMMASMTVTEFQISDMKVHWLDTNTAVVVYKWTGKGTAMGQAIPSPTYASTVWVNSGGKWMAHFHQESIGMEMGK